MENQLLWKRLLIGWFKWGGNLNGNAKPYFVISALKLTDGSRDCHYGLVVFLKHAFKRYVIM